MKNHKLIDKLVHIGIYGYLIIPILILLLFWFKWYVSIPCILLLVVGFTFLFKKFQFKKEEEYKKIFNYKKLILIFGVIIVINLLSGAGGVFFQNWDYSGRNAIFRDLIQNSWPVHYDYTGLSYESAKFGNAGMLVYYFAFWLPGAIVGKLLGFHIASLFMLIWQIIGVTFFFYLVFRKMSDVKWRYLFIFLTIGGINVIGQIIVNHLTGSSIVPIGVNHIDTSMAPFCMSSFITQLFWVFNQSVPAWIVTMLFFQDIDYKKCGYLFALLVPYAPFPMLGLLYLIFAFIIFGKDLNKRIDFDRFKSLFTIPNIFGVLSILPIVAMFSLNTSKKGIVLIDAYNNGHLGSVLIYYLLFVVLEFGVYIVILNKNNWRKLLLYFAYFAVVPLFYIGGADLGNRSTIPLLIGLYLLVIEFLNTIEVKHSARKVQQIMLLVVLFGASFTNFNEIYRSINYTHYNYVHKVSNFHDQYQTFSTFKDKECSAFITNFVAKYDKNKFYLKYIVR